MAEPATKTAHPISRALAEPTEPVSKRWIGGLGLASLVMWMAALTPANFLIPAQLDDINHSSAKLALGLISAAAAISSMLATPLVGAISDRTTRSGALGHLHGRRHRWTLLFALLGAAASSDRCCTRAGTTFAPRSASKSA